MKKVVNGELVDMTPEEMAKLEKYEMQMPDLPPSTEERLKTLEEKYSKITGILKKWLDV